MYTHVRFEPIVCLMVLVTLATTTATVEIAGPRSAIAASGQAGGVLAWGSARYGGLGNGDTTGPEECLSYLFSPCSRVPIPVPGLKEVTAVAPGFGVSLALLRDGHVMAWGGDDGNAEPESNVPVEVEGLSDVTAIASGGLGNHALALLANGTVMGWGFNNRGQDGNGTTEEVRRPVQVRGLSEVVAISAGPYESMALLRNGTVMAWGENDEGQLGDGTTSGPEECGASHIACSTLPVPVSNLSGVTAIAAGERHGLALESNGTVMAWGNNESGELGNGTTESSDVPVIVPALTEVTGVAIAHLDSFALLRGGAVKSWGYNFEGELGDGTSRGPETCGHASVPSCSTIPVNVAGLHEVTALAGGSDDYTLALLANGRVDAWGSNSSGQLGDGSTENSDVPAPVSSLHHAVAIGAGENTSLAVASPQFQTAEYVGWIVSGSLTPRKLSQAILLPTGATFTGSGELNTETGAGSIDGNLSVPPFAASLKLFGLLPTRLGVSLQQVGPIEGSIATSETVSGAERLTIPVKFTLGITSVSLLGVEIPTRCRSAEPLSLNLVDNLSREELLSKGWRFTGTATLPRVSCEGSLGPLVGAILSILLSGPGNPYSLNVSAPSA